MKTRLIDKFYSVINIPLYIIWFTVVESSIAVIYSFNNIAGNGNIIFSVGIITLIIGLYINYKLNYTLKAKKDKLKIIRISNIKIALYITLPIMLTLISLLVIAYIITFVLH